ncbi:MAG: ATP-binding protein [Polyangia bacterium]
MRLLIVDDDEDDFIITRDILRETQMESLDVRWLADFDEAREALCSGSYDAVLLDYRLGAHTGLELLQHAQAQRCKTPIILLTGLGDREVDVAAMRAGAADYLIKSELRPDLLERAIRYAVERARTQAALDALNQRLMHEHTMLLRAERLSSVGLIAASVAHEINNPLCGVMGLVKALRGRTLPENKFNEYIKTIQEGLERMRGTVQGLLDLVRERPLEITRVDAAEVIEECLRLCGVSARKKQVELKLSLQRAEAMVSADRSRLAQVMINLLLNAIYATPSGGSVEFSAVRDGDRIGLRVSDTGVGMPREVLERVCEPFFTTKPTGQGTGLGLAVVSSIVKAHKGELAIDSAPGSGTTITVWLPRAQRSQNVAEPAAASASALAPVSLAASSADSA